MKYSIDTAKEGLLTSQEGVDDVGVGRPALVQSVAHHHLLRLRHRHVLVTRAPRPPRRGARAARQVQLLLAALHHVPLQLEVLHLLHRLGVHLQHTLVRTGWRLGTRESRHTT